MAQKDGGRPPFQIHQIRNWKKYVKPKNLFIGNFADIIERPHKLIKKVLYFLKVKDHYRLPKAIVEKSVNATEKSTIPKNHIKLLAELFKYDIEEMNNNYNLKW